MDDFDFDSAPVATQQPPTFENQGFGSNNDSFAQPDAPYDAQAEDVQQQQFASKFPALKEFEKKRDERIQKKDNDSKEKHDQMVAQAKAFKSGFVSERDQRISTAKKTNLEQETLVKQSFEHQHDNVWENVSKYVDLTNNPAPKKKAVPKKKRNAFEDDVAETTKQPEQTAEETPAKETKDTSRMRKILIQLKNE